MIYPDRRQEILKKSLINKALALFLTVLVLMSALIIPGENVTAAATDYSTIRVLLSSMKTVSTIDITVNGTYSIQNISDSAYSFRNNVLLRKGVVYNFTASNGNVVMKQSGSSETFSLGKSFTLYSHTVNRNDYLTMKNTSYGNCNYIGNMTIRADGNSLVFTNELNLDDYLCGVVPYEMSNGQEIESLKTQAVCARSYAYYYVVSARNSGASYDVVDTTSNQVYKGFNASHTRTISAVDQTAAQVLKYGGKCISTYYSSSNGGITEDNHNAWGGTKLAYLNVRVDPYDTASRGRVYTMSKTNVSAKNQELILAVIKSSIESKGYDYSSASIVSIDKIVPTYFDEPASLATTDRRVYSLDFTVTVKAKKSGTSTYSTFQEKFSRTRERVRTFLYYVNSSGSNTTLPSTKFKIQETSTSFVITADGNGHGIGLSQNGTYGRAAAGQTYDQILAFYYENAKLSTLSYVSTVVKPTPSGEYNETEVSGYSKLTNSLTGTVNANASRYPKAGAIYQPNGTVQKDTRVAIVGQTANWYEIVLDDAGSTAFVWKKCITLDGNGTPLSFEDGGMFVATVTDDVWARSSAEYIESNILEKFTAGSEVIVTGIVGAFSKIYYKGADAYVSSVNVKVTGEKVFRVYDAEVRAYKAGLYREKSVKSPKNGYLPEGTKVKVFDISYGFAGLVYNGSISYIKTDKIDIDVAGTSGIILPGEGTQVDLNLKITVSTNAYKEADSNSGPEQSLEEGDVVNAITLKDDWYTIIFGDGYTYVESSDVMIYSENITFGYAVATADKLLYSSEEHDEVAAILKAGETVEMISGADGTVIFIYEGLPCFADTDNLRIEIQSKIV